MVIFTMGSGFLAAAAVIGLMILRTIKAHSITRAQILTIICGLAVIALGLAMKVSVANHEKYQAKSFLDFLEALLENLAWPLGNRPAMAMLFCLPLAITFASYFRRDFKNPRAAEFVLALGL